MFCKVCFDASRNGFNTHNIKDNAGNIICPLLLNTKCMKCNYFGHTIKYCKFNFSKKEFIKKEQVYNPIKHIKKTNLFNLLFENDNDIVIEDVIESNNDVVIEIDIDIESNNNIVIEIDIESNNDIVIENEIIIENDIKSNNNNIDYRVYDDTDIIIWGVGLKSMIGKSWADVCCV